MTSDPFVLYEEFSKSWEKLMTRTMEDAMRSSAFTDAMGRTLRSSLDMKKGMDDLMERAIAAMHLPSKKDCEELTSRLSSVEATLRRVSDKIDALSAQRKNT